MGWLFQCDRAKLAKEKQLKEDALKEKAELERKLSRMQEEVRTAQEMLVRIWMGYFERSEEFCIVKWACSMISKNYFFFDWWTQDIFHVFPILFSYVEKLTLMNIWIQFCVVIHVDCFASFRNAQRRPQSFLQRRHGLRRKRLNSSLRKPQIPSEKSRASKLLPLRWTTLVLAVWEVWNF